MLGHVPGCHMGYATRSECISRCPFPNMNVFEGFQFRCRDHVDHMHQGQQEQRVGLMKEGTLGLAVSAPAEPSLAWKI